MDSTPTSQSRAEDRKRVRHACQPCQARKRRCDGNEPCSVCLRLDDDCFYEDRPRKRVKKPEGSSTPQNPVPTFPPRLSRGTNPAAWEAYSASSLPARVEERLVSMRHKKDLTAWNLGIRHVSSTVGPSLDQLIGCEDMLRYAETYFRTVGLLYRFLDQDKVITHIKRRFETKVEDDSDMILLAVALIGSYFVHATANLHQSHLYAALDAYIARTTNAEIPCLEAGAALYLKAIYMRPTSTPFASWRTSCESIHALEVTQGQELSSALFDRDRLYWSAHIFQSWISNEYGRPNLRLFTTAEVNECQFDDWPIFTLFKFSRWLNMECDPDDNLLADLISQISSLQFDEAAPRLSQAYLGVAFFRYMRLRTENISPTTIGELIVLGNVGCAAVRTLVEDTVPLWHLVSFPFQFLSAMLVIDTPIALDKVGDALDTIEAVATKFPSQSVLQTLDKSRRMVTLLRKRKQEEFDILSRALKIPKADPQQNVNGYSNGHVQPTAADSLPSVGPDLLNFGGLDWFSYDESMMLAGNRSAPYQTGHVA